MQDRELWTHGWNLPLHAAASLVLAACGPTVIPAGETDTDAATDTDPGPTEATDTTAGQCNDASDCAPGEDCIGGVCMPYDDYCDYSECCYEDCHYYECYSDAECGPMGICVDPYEGCAYPEQLPECEAVPRFEPLELPPTEGNFVSMSFVDANGDAALDLIVGRTGGTELHLGGSEPAPPVLLPLEPGDWVYDAASGDFDGDGDADLVFSASPSTLVLAAGNGDGTFAVVQSLALGWSPDQLVPLQWNGEGGLELVTVGSNGEVVLHRTDAGVFAFSEPFLTVGEEILSVTAFDYDGDASGDLVIQSDLTTQVFLGNAASDVTSAFELTGEVRGPRRLWSALLGPQPADELIGLTPLDGWVLLELWPNGQRPRPYALVDDGYDAKVGDLDGDGVDDVITRSTVGVVFSGLSFVRGSNDGGQPALTCRSDYLAGALRPSWGAYEVGDFDGNGRADVAIELEGAVTVMLTQ